MISGNSVQGEGPRVWPGLRVWSDVSGMLRQSRRWAIGMGACLAIGGVVAGPVRQHWLGGGARPGGVPVTGTVQAAVQAVTRVSALGRLEPQGEVIQVFAPLSVDGARVERLTVRHGQWVRQGEGIAVLDVYAQRLAAVQEAQRQVEVARSRLAQVQAGAKRGEIQAQQEQVNQIQAELETERAAQQTVIARIEAERETEIAAQTATIAGLRATVQNAALEDQRYQALFREGAVAETVRDRTRLTLVTSQESLAAAEANLARISRSRQQQIQEARAQLARIVASRQRQLAGARASLVAIAEVRPVDVALARSQLAAAAATVARAEANLARATVRSPQAGQERK